MPAQLTFSLSTVFGFVLVLARVSGAFIFVPLPGLSAGPEIARAVLASEPGFQEAAKEKA